MNHLRSIVCVLCLAIATTAHAGAADGKLDFYFIDVEGGAATLIVTPAGESILIDTGNPGERDPGRILAATKLAGVSKIDSVIISHYHGDHFGGAAPLAKLIPIGTIYDNGEENPSRDRPTPEYLAIKADKRIMINPGDLLPLKQSDKPGAAKLSLQCLAARKKFIDAAAGATTNPFSDGVRGKRLDLSDNANSIVVLLKFGGFRFLDAGDLTWNIEYDLVTPVNRVGTIDVFKVTHHGLDQSNNPAMVKAIQPTVAIMTNGTTKGAAAEVFTTLRATPSIKEIFQVHKNLRNDGDVNNTNPKFIANMETNCQGNHIGMSVVPDGKSYAVGIPATKFEKTYETREHK